MNDLQVLGLSGDFTIITLKKAFRQKSKQFHPDRNNDNLKSHLAMIRVNQAYSNLMKTLNEKNSKDNTEKSFDPYSIYKEGIMRFQSIHPSRWKTISKTALFNADAVETHPETTGILRVLINDMAKAYHSFSIIANEYPASCWAQDAENKLREIEKMTERYRKILDSYQREMNFN